MASHLGFNLVSAIWVVCRKHSYPIQDDTLRYRQEDSLQYADPT